MSSKNYIEITPEGNIEVYVTHPPVKNLANKAVVELLSGYFKVPKAKIRIVKGFTSRYKQVEVL